jgi:hypothetical protein
LKCLDSAHIARVLALDLDEPHVRDCLACRRRLEADRATRDLLRVLPAPALGTARRQALAAEILATAENLPRRRRRGRAFAAASGALAMAAAISLVAWWPREPASIVASPSVTSVETIAIGASSVESDDSPPAPAPQISRTIDAPLIVATRGTTFRHATGADRDVVTLVDGALELDTRSARRVDVRVGESIVRVENASVKIEARTRSIISVRVIVGSARIDSPDEHVMLQRDSEWIPAPPAATKVSSAKAHSLAAFRDAWIALRAGENRDAMSLFDSVTDAVALEEARYWAVIAARRANDASLSNRIAAFLRAFPDSEYASELRAAQ